MSTSSVRRPVASVLLMPQLASSAMAALRSCPLSITEYSLLVACQRDDFAFKFALSPIECTDQEKTVLRQMERRGLIEFNAKTMKWELCLPGQVFLDLVNILAHGPALIRETAAKVIEMPVRNHAENVIPLDTEQNSDETLEA